MPRPEQPPSSSDDRAQLRAKAAAARAQLASGEWKRRWSNGAARPELITDAEDREPVDRTPPHWLPDEFWASHPRLAQIRRVAVSRRICPDNLLDICLARVGAITHHQARLPDDEGASMGLGLYVSPIGGSGTGKSTAMKLARQLIPAPDDVADPISPGSGEAIPDAFFGFVGKARRQVRANGVVEYSEGSKLFHQSGRSGSTLTSVIRGAFTNDTIGEDLVDKTRCRKLLADEYVLSIVVGFQPPTAAPLFTSEEVAAGTPQRFLFSRAGRLPHHDLLDGEVAGTVDPIWAPVPTGTTITPAEGGEFTLPKVVDFCREAMDEVSQIRDARSRYDAQFDELDAHETSVRMKVAADLALLLDSAYRVSPVRWEQAREIYQRSSRVRLWVLSEIESAAAIEEDKRRRVHVHRQRAAAIDTATEFGRALDSLVKSAVVCLAKHTMENHHADEDRLCRNSCISSSGNSTARRIVGGANRVHRELIDRGLAVVEGEDRHARWSLADDIDITHVKETP